MSLMINSSGSNVSSTAKSTAGTKTGESVTTAALPFGQTLVQMLIATLGGQVATDTANTQKAQEVSKGDSVDSLPSTETKDTEDTAGLEDVLQSMGDLDALIAADPSLMATLQGWLQQVQQFLNPELYQASGDSGEVQEQGSALPTIAKHPDTIRFAVQDSIAQLLNELNSSSEVSTKDNTLVLQKLELSPSILVQEKVGKGAVNLNDATLQNVSNFENTNVMGSKEDLVTSQLFRSLQKIISQAKENQSIDNASLPSKLGDVKIVKDSLTPLSAVMAKASKGNALHLEDSTTEHKLSTADNVVMTAGQLQMRESGTFTIAKVATSAVPVDQFAKEMGSFVVSKLDILKLQGGAEARIILFPEHMGQVDVKITLQNGQLIAQFATEHASAKDSLEQQMNQLRVALQNQGIQVEKLEVTQNQSLSSHMYHDGRQSGSGAGKQHQGTRQRGEATDDAIQMADMTDEWNDWVREVRSKEEGYGSSFVAKA
ncbi:flagellar hook-length control protein FliK [Paenibacillus shirakamiensis]|uniref:Flagellar hook-length control protein FliK n=1 Tax=Paenibacillus shirakamiensis TaxID=1265935 RepID=A0ABS4JJE8_9BACL|nr:flagellar hook-length control protein FliK [Paenibacillus shirakamiensis]MBP2001116.1 flagellar hook-length control protein FliK [Paenibacillus shirakamiensis]